MGFELFFRLLLKIKRLYVRLFVCYIHGLFQSCGRSFWVGPSFVWMGLKHVSVGDNFRAGDRFKLRTFDEWGGVKYSPQITIGNNVNIETDCHISAINNVSIGNNVLIASFVYISDHAHGDVNDKDSCLLPPLKRQLFSKGPIIIEDDVWIGEKARCAYWTWCYHWSQFCCYTRYSTLCYRCRCFS